MSAERVSMRKVREALRLRHALGMSCRAISAATGIGRTAAAEYVRRAALIGITWPVPDGLDDAELELRLYPQERKVRRAGASTSRPSRLN